ncbi:adenylyltransferase/cytidyltransferase family protein [Kribbella sp. NPDC020789]
MAEFVSITQPDSRALTEEYKSREPSKSHILVSQHAAADADRIRVLAAGDTTASPADSYEEFDLIITTREEMEYFETLNDARRQRGLDGYDILCNAPSYTPIASDETRSPRRPFRLVSVGGTFNALHDGHREYLKLALRLADKVHILLASDAYAKQRKAYHPRPLSNRRRSIKTFLDNLNCTDRVEIQTLKNVADIERYVTGEDSLDLVLVEFAYMKWFDEWNFDRIQHGHPTYGMLCKSRTAIHGVELSSSMIASERPSVQPSAQIPFFQSIGVNASRLAATD